MATIPNYLSEVYSKEIYSVTEADFDEVMSASAVEDDWTGYDDWSREVEVSLAPSTLYIDKDGKVQKAPEPPSQGRIGGIEL